MSETVTSGLYYKRVTIVIDAPSVVKVTLQIVASLTIVKFIVLASFTIVTYDRQNMFIIQATVYPNYGSKKFYNIGHRPWVCSKTPMTRCRIHNTSFSLQLTNGSNKLERLAPTSLFCLA